VTLTTYGWRQLESGASIRHHRYVTLHQEQYVMAHWAPELCYAMENATRGKSCILKAIVVCYDERERDNPQECFCGHAQTGILNRWDSRHTRGKIEPPTEWPSHWLPASYSSANLLLNSPPSVLHSMLLLDPVRILSDLPTRS
jgi:hypothetical protein